MVELSRKLTCACAEGIKFIKMDSVVVNVNIN